MHIIKRIFVYYFNKSIFITCIVSWLFILSDFVYNNSRQYELDLVSGSSDIIGMQTGTN